MTKKIKLWILCSFFVLAAYLPAQHTALHHFAGPPADGSYPFGSLVCGGKTLYGMTNYGGAEDRGCIFKINKDGAGFSLLHSFADSETNGYVTPGTLLLKGKTLYGVAGAGGAMDRGILFKINTNGTGFAILHSFLGGEGDGYEPMGGLAAKGDTLYGTTKLGGANNLGTIYAIKTNGTGFRLLHSFLGGTGDGGSPERVTLAFKGSTMYGMAYGGGDSDLGIIFKINTNSTGYGILHSFTGAADGKNPFGSLLLKGKAMYGMTYAGGADDEGVIFKANLDGSGFLVLHHFSYAANDGGRPHGALTANGKVLYGLTYRGGEAGAGTIFTYNLKTNAFAVIYSFLFNNASRGSNPQGSLILKNKILYAMTCTGGGSNKGTVFSYSTK